MKTNKTYPEFLADIADWVADSLIELKISDQEAAKIGLEVAEKLRTSHGGECLYFPKGVSYDCSKRDIEILEMFDGSNFREVCDKFKITRRRIYQILQATRAGRQKFMDFGEDEDEEADSGGKHQSGTL